MQVRIKCAILVATQYICPLPLHSVHQLHFSYRMLNLAVNSSAQLKCSTQVLNSSAQLDCSTQLVICPGVFSRAGRRAAAGTACVGTRGSRPQQSACRYGTAAAASFVFCRPSQIVLFSRSTTTPSRISRRQAERNGHARQHDAASAVRRVLDGDVGSALLPPRSDIYNIGNRSS